MAAMTSRRRRFGLAITWLGLLVVAALAGAGASYYVINRSVGIEPTADVRQTYQVTDLTLDRMLRLPGTGTWSVVGSIQAQASGVITDIVAQPGLIQPGDVLLRVDERPTMALAGEIPAFRTMSVGISGRDVAGLQRYLADLGYVVDPRLENYSEVTERAVAAWHDAIGVAPTGEVVLGEIVFMPKPAFAAPMRWTNEVLVGVTISAGTPILERLAPEPDLTIEFGGGSAPAGVSPGLSAKATFADGRELAVVISDVRFENGRRWATLTAPTGMNLCKPDDCQEIVPLSAEANFDVTVVLIPPTTGPGVPIAAVQSDAIGQAFVEMVDGSRRIVHVRVSSGGTAIVDGLAAGDTILLP